MNYKIKEKCCLALASVVLSLAGISSIAAQTSEPLTATAPSKTEQIYVVSAQAGGVSAITGTARVERAGSTKILTIGDELAAKEKVSVETNGKVEVLLNPGSYLRVGGDSGFEFTNTALDALGVNLSSGSALIEAAKVNDDKGASISISTPQTTVQLEKTGLYRINVTSEMTEIFVWDGEAKVGSELVKKGRKLTIGKTGAATVAKFDKDKILPDELDLWSKTRAEELAKLNQELERANLAQSFASLNDYDYSYSTGYWCYNRITHRWCYVPFAWARCCRAYNHQHTNQIAINRSSNTGSAPVVVVVNKEDRSRSPKYNSTDGYHSETRENSSPSKSETRENSSPSKSETRANSSPSKNDSTPAKSDSKPSTREDSSPKKKD